MALDEIQLVPHERELVRTARRKVTLYMVGIELWRAHNGRIPPVHVKGAAFDLPELGRDMVVDEVLAKDLVFQTTYLGKSALLTAEQGGEEMAQLILEAFESGEDVTQLDLTKMRRNMLASDLSDDEVLALARQRGLINVPEDELIHQELDPDSGEDFPAAVQKKGKK